MMSLRTSGEGVDLAGLLKGLSLAPAPAVTVDGLTLDSRQIKAGWMFIACQGGNGHGMTYAEQAVVQGACVILAEPALDWSSERLASVADRLGVPVLSVPGLRAKVSEIAGRFYGHPSADMRVVGVTGTNGKTSVTHFLAQVLAQDVATGIIGTLGNGPLGATMASTHTTPDAVELQRELARQRDLGIATIAMEVSSHGLDQGRSAAIRFDTAMFTNLSRDHLDYHGTMAAYGEAKARLFQAPGLRLGVVNTDYALGLELVRSCDAHLVAVGRESHCRELGVDYVQLRHLSALPDGLELAFDSTWGSGQVEVPLFGLFNGENLLPVIAILLLQGMSVDEMAGRLAALSPIPGRMEPVTLPGWQAPLIMVDYAHTPDALEQALMSVRGHCKGRLLCVFGCGGDRDSGKRPLMGGVAERLADHVILTDDNPRREDGDRIIADILAGMTQTDQAQVERQRKRAIRNAIESAEPDDLILIAGKGHEDYQLVGDLRLDHSDADEVRATLRELMS